MHVDLKRRLLCGSGAAAAVMPLRALAEWGRLCPNDPSISQPSAPLSIDAHAHFFNGSDLQISAFLSQVVGKDSELSGLLKVAGPLLKFIAWHTAANAKSERNEIERYARELQCSGEEALKNVALPAYRRGYEAGHAQLRNALAKLPRKPGGPVVLGPTETQSDLVRAISDMPPTYDEFEGDNNGKPTYLASHPTVAGYVQFVLHHFNYRHINAIDYLRTFSEDPRRKIDLVVSAMVDYDWWLAGGKATATSLSDQVELAGRISSLTGGRVHGFVPFCPFRETMTRDAKGIGDAMRLVKTAIDKHGCIGVKLYPPMGFAPWGNSGQDVWRNDQRLPAAARARGFGARLDRAMVALFHYCQEQDVPIMAHTNHSNGPNDSFESLAGSHYWQQALATFPGLRVNFGHFGDTDLEDHEPERPRAFLSLMTAGAGSPGANAFADTGYFAGVLSNQTGVSDTLLDLLANNAAPLPERLMYGSDWTMILPEQNERRYLSDFIDVFERIETARPDLRARNAPIKDAFFGRNAAEFLGLAKGRMNRARLEKFYARNNVATPDWMRKVDQLG